MNLWENYIKVDPAASGNYRFKTDYSRSLKMTEYSCVSTRVFPLLMLLLSNSITGLFPLLMFNLVSIPEERNLF